MASTRKRTTKVNPVPARRAPTPRGVAASTQVTTRAALKRPALGLALTVDAVRYARDLIREVPNFPSPGVLFRDLTPLLADPKAFTLVTDSLASRFIGESLDAVVAVESRGFIFGAAIAQRLNLSFVPVRKPGKLPREVHQVSYTLEYGEAVLQMHCDALQPGAHVLVVDDLLATGGTASAAGELVRQHGAAVAAYVFVVELLGLAGRGALEPTPVFSLIQYE